MSDTVYSSLYKISIFESILYTDEVKYTTYSSKSQLLDSLYHRKNVKYIIA